MERRTVYLNEATVKHFSKTIKGTQVKIEGEQYYKISNYDQMPPFLMSIVSDSDLWMFISSNGALTAGRRNPDNAIFPYCPDDRIHDSPEVTGNRTIIFARFG